MKELIITIGLVILGVIIASLILSDTGLIGSTKDLFVNQIQYLSQ